MELPPRPPPRRSNRSILERRRELAREVDEIGWHPFYQTDPDQLAGYAADVRATPRLASQRRIPRALHGRPNGTTAHCIRRWLMADSARAWCGGFQATEIEKAKYVAQVFTRHTALGMESFFCEMYFPQFGVLDLSLLRRSFDADPIPPLQPQAAYYVTRNLATMLDELEPGDAGVLDRPRAAEPRSPSAQSARRHGSGPLAWRPCKRPLRRRADRSAA